MLKTGTRLSEALNLRLLCRVAATLVVCGGFLLLGSSLFAWVDKPAWNPARSTYQVPGGGEQQVAFTAGILTVAVGMLGLAWRLAIAGLAALVGLVPLFLTLVLASEIRSRPYERASGTTETVALYVAIASSALVAVAGMITLVAVVLAKRRSAG